jgi:hypothetical protein
MYLTLMILQNPLFAVEYAPHCAQDEDDTVFITLATPYVYKVVGRLVQRQVYSGNMAV